MKNTVRKQFEEIIYPGIFCDINNCASKNFYIPCPGSNIAIFKRRACNCGGEEARKECIASLLAVQKKNRTTCKGGDTMAKDKSKKQTKEKKKPKKKK